MVLFQQTQTWIGRVFLLVCVLVFASVSCSKRPKTFGVYASDAKTRMTEVPYVLQECGCEGGYCKTRMKRTASYKGSKCTFGLTAEAFNSAVSVSRAEFVIYLANPARIEHFKIGGKAFVSEQGCKEGLVDFCTYIYIHGTEEIKQEVEPKDKGVFVLRATEDLTPGTPYWIVDANPNAPKAYPFRLGGAPTTSEDEEFDQGDIIEDERTAELEVINERWVEFVNAIVRQDEKGARATFHPAVFDPAQSRRNWNSTWQELVEKRETLKGSVVVGIEKMDGNNTGKQGKICVLYSGSKRLAARVIFANGRWWLKDHSSGPCQ